MATETESSPVTSQPQQVGSSLAPTDEDPSPQATASEAPSAEIPLKASSHGKAFQARETPKASVEEFDPATLVITAASSGKDPKLESSSVAVASAGTNSVAMSTVTMSPVPFSSSVDSSQDNTRSILGFENTAMSIVTVSPILASAFGVVTPEGRHPVSDPANTRNTVVMLYPFPASASVSGNSGDNPTPTTTHSVSGFIHSRSAYNPSNIATSIIYEVTSESEPISASATDATMGPLASSMMSVMGQAHPSTNRQSSEILPAIVFDASMDSVLPSTPNTPTRTATDTRSHELVPTAGTRASPDSSKSGTTRAPNEPSQSALLFAGQGAQMRGDLSTLRLVLWVGIAVVMFAA